MEGLNRQNVKVYVKVNVTFDEDGLMLPRSLIWEDGHPYKIDRVLDIRPAYAEKAGGQGDRYTVKVGNRESYLFFERNADEQNKRIGRWFVERK